MHAHSPPRNTHLRIWDFAHDGSPTMQMLMSPRRAMPSRVSLCTPPNSMSSTACLMESWPQTLGTMLRVSLR